MDVVAARLADRYPMNKAVGVRCRLQADLVGDVRTALYVMLAAVASLLLVAALNLAGLCRRARRREAASLPCGWPSARRASGSYCNDRGNPATARWSAARSVSRAASPSAFVPLAPATLPRVESIAVDSVVVLWRLVVLRRGLVATPCRRRRPGARTRRLPPR